MNSYFSDMDVFNDINVDDIRVDVVRYCQRDLDFGKPNPTEIWHKALLLCKDKPEWCGVSHLALVIEICLCTPCSNALLERFFNHLKVVKTDQRVTLLSSSLNSILPIGRYAVVRQLSSPTGQ